MRALLTPQVYAREGAVRGTGQHEDLSTSRCERVCSGGGAQKVGAVFLAAGRRVQTQTGSGYGTRPAFGSGISHSHSALLPPPCRCVGARRGVVSARFARRLLVVDSIEARRARDASAFP